MGQLGQRHGAHGVVLAEAAPLEEAVEHAERAQGAREAAALDPRLAPRGEKGAHVAGIEREQLPHIRQPIEMGGEKGEELAEIPRIGLRRVRRQLALDGEVVEPALGRLANVRRPHEGRRFGLFGHAGDPVPVF